MNKTQGPVGHRMNLSCAPGMIIIVAVLPYLSETKSIFNYYMSGMLRFLDDFQCNWSVLYKNQSNIGSVSHWCQWFILSWKNNDTPRIILFHVFMAGIQDSFIFRFYFFWWYFKNISYWYFGELCHSNYRVSLQISI